MSALSRRAMVKNGLLAVGSGLLAPGIFEAIAASPALAATPNVALTSHRAGAGNGKILVVVQMAGGHDGLHGIIPYTDPLYNTLRPTLGVPAANRVTLSSTLALHSGLGALMPLWNAGQMGIVENVGYPNPNLSHFQSMYIWQTLDLTGAQGASRTGWLGKYLASTSSGGAQNPFMGINAGSELPTAFMDPSISVPSINNAKTFAFRNDAQTQAVLQFTKSFAATGTAQSGFGSLLTSISETAVASVAQFKQATTQYKPAVTYPPTPLGQSLELVATAIAQNLGVRVGYVTLGGFDTHANEGPTLDTLYPQLAQAIAAFWQDMQAHGMAENVLMMTWSEFGRRAKENGSQGTDHGTAAPLFVFGPGVAGGIHGDTPNLANLDANGNLVFQTDFRSVYATVIQNWLGGDAASALGATYPLLDFVK
jgi:uncharacterized protein (DUF1501 family)